MQRRVVIVGAGVVGQALGEALKGRAAVEFHDPPKGIWNTAALLVCDIVILTVPTPYIPETGFDPSALEQALGQIPGSKIVVIKSTVIPGTTDRLQEKYPQHYLLFSPEFLTEKTATYDAAHPTRSIVGYTNKSEHVAWQVLELLPSTGFVRKVPAKTAETIKYFANSFYALKVAFANQFFDLCGELGVDYHDLYESACYDPMMGGTHLIVGRDGYRGYGGKCLPKDTKALLDLAKSLGLDLSILEAASKYNDSLNK